MSGWLAQRMAAFDWDRFCALLAMSQRRGITVKISPVPEREDATEHRGYVVIELCMPPVDPTPASCYFTPATSPSTAVRDALNHLLLEGK